MSRCGSCQLVENGGYLIGWMFLDVLKLYEAAVPETNNLPFDR